MNPRAGLVMDSAGNLNGTAGGGINCCRATTGYGIVFELTPGGEEVILHAFGGARLGARPKGVDPTGPLTIDASGNLYGTTAAGGTRRRRDGGTVFELVKQ